jgi:PAS domain S-box-containing protein
MRWSSTSTSLATAFTIALVVIVSTAYLSLDNQRRLKSAHTSSLRRGSIVDHIDRLLYAIKDAETSSRAYLITGEPQYLESFENTVEQIRDYRDRLKPVLTDDNEQQERLKTFDSLVDKKLNGMQTRVAVMRTRGFEEARKLFLSSNRPSVMTEIVNLLREEEEHERSLQQEEDRELEVRFRNDSATDSLFAGITTLIVTLFFIVANRQSTKRAQTEKALQISEDRYYSLIENGLDGIFVSNLEGTLLYVNPAGRELTGQSNEQLIGTQWLKVIHPEDQKLIRMSLNNVVTGIEDSIRVEARVNPKNGPIRWIEASANKAMFGHNQEVIIASCRDITDRRGTEQALRESEERYREAGVRLQNLSRRLIEIQEIERHQLAVELHDEMGQLLTAIQMNLKSIQTFEDAKTKPAYLEESLKLLGQLLEQVRNLSLELRPLVLDHLGLVPALRWYVDRLAQRGVIKAEFKSKITQERFTPQIETTCFRIAQEALTNALRHSQAKHVKVELTRDDSKLILTISDDGIGIDTEEVERRMKEGMSFGIEGMRERASLVNGTFNLSLNEGSGTTIAVGIPLVLDANNKAQ